MTELTQAGSSYIPDQKLIDQIENNFIYHAPKGTQQDRYVSLREQGRRLARLFAENVHESRELSLALTKLEEAVMWANAGIARNE